MLEISMSAMYQKLFKKTKIASLGVPIAALALLIAVSAPAPAFAASSSTTKTSDTKAATGGGSVQGYASDAALQIGTVVQLTGGDATKVEAATSKNLPQMYGVVVDPHALSLTISSASLANEAFVATSGTYKALVSTQGGEIAAGDYLTMSAINGVLMKASTDQKTVFGRAASSFAGKNNTIGSTQLKDTGGATNQTVALGIIPVTINVQRNPTEKSTQTNLPKPLQKVGEAIADKPVSPLRIYLSIGITGLSIIVSLVTLYAGIRNAIIAIGRNPLSKKSVFRGLFEVILTGFLILIIGLFAVYLLLKL
jgi:hypothetical protein